MPDSEWVQAGTVQELNERGVVLVHGGERPVVVFAEGGEVYAVDGRCPHMGFPLNKGTVEDGILTCHWHQARFDLRSGCTFDLFADDVPVFDTRIENGVVFVSRDPLHQPGTEHYLHRLASGMQHNTTGVIAKSVGKLLDLGVSHADTVRQAAVFGSTHHDNWGPGMTTLTMVANLAPHLSQQTIYYALYRAVQSVSADCANAVPRRVCKPLETEAHTAETLSRWLRRWVHARDRIGSERVLLTLLPLSPSPAQLTDSYFTAASDRVYPNAGHVFDFGNKAFELLDAIGWEHAGALLPLLINGLVGARGQEENAAWHHPLEIIEPLLAAQEQLPELMRRGQGKTWAANGAFMEVLLGDDPLALVTALTEALGAGAPPAELSKRVAYAAGMRLARFSKNNEISDWFRPQHTFSYANAVHQAVKRAPTPGVVRGVFHGALSVYMDRFLNVPAAPLPPPGEALDHLPSAPQDLTNRLLASLNHREEGDAASEVVARYLRLGHPVQPLVDTLALATVREDLDFHYLQVLEAGVRLHEEWAGQPEGEHILLGVVRNLAAACPTRRAALQAANVASRLNRGEKIYEDEADTELQ